MSENALEGTLCRTKISEYTTPPMNALVTALPGLVIIFVLAGGVNALAGVLFIYINHFLKKALGPKSEGPAAYAC